LLSQDGQEELNSEDVKLEEEFSKVKEKQKTNKIMRMHKS